MRLQACYFLLKCKKVQFGGWKWQREDMIHGPKIERFAKYPDGRIERPS